MSLKKFKKKRDQFLSKPFCYKSFMAYLRETGNTWTPTSEKFAEVAFHKARTGSKGVPKEIRKESKSWLAARGYSDFS